MTETKYSNSQMLYIAESAYATHLDFSYETWKLCKEYKHQVSVNKEKKAIMTVKSKN